MPRHGTGLIVLATGMLAWSLAVAARADDTGYPVQQVSYTTGAQGNKLKWLPYRPAKGARATQLAQRETGQPWVPSSQPPASSNPSSTKPAGENPFKNPFGDKPAGQPSLPRDVPSPLPSGDLFPKSETPPKRLFESTLPELPAEPETVAAEPKPTEPQAQKTEPPQGSEPPEQIPPSKPDVPRIEQDLLASAQGREGDCLKPEDLKPINKITNDITAEKGEFPAECPLGDKPFTPRSWAPTNFAWTASGLCHKPLYFEDVQLERYGHSWGPYIQPIISGGHFFLTVPVLPYKMGVNPPNECLYTLGYYRPGSCAPYMLDPIPISVRAALFEAGVWTGMAYLIP